MKSEMEQDILKVLVTEEELKARVAELGAELYDRFQGKNPLFLGVLKGSFVFMADLVRACQLQSDVEFIAVSSYQNSTVSSGRCRSPTTSSRTSPAATSSLWRTFWTPATPWPF